MAIDIDSLKLTPEELRLEFDPAQLGFDCTEDIAPLAEFVGQDRALSALKFGLGLRKPGYNIFVTGLSGTGKATAILDFIRRRVEEQDASGTAEVPPDLCYLYNFDEPDRPNAIAVPAGQGRVLRDRLDKLLEQVRTNLTNAFQSEEYQRLRKETLEAGQARAQELMEDAQSMAQEAGFMLRFSPAGMTLVPLIEGKPMTPEQFQELTADQRKEISQREKPITDAVNEVGEKLRAIEREVGEKVAELDRQVAELVTNGSFETIEAEYHDAKEIPDFLLALKTYTLTNVRTLLGDGDQSPFPFPMPGGQGDPFIVFRCNVIVDNSQAKGPPIVVEENPNYPNLFGRIERRAQFGAYLSDHTLLRGGAVHRANGGYLILNLMDIATKPGAWDGIRRLIRTGEVRIEDPTEQYGILTPQALRPEPIPVNVKLIVTGDPMSYFLLSAYDEEFWEMFKVKADFDFQIERTGENVSAYAGFVCSVCEKEKLAHFDAAAVARIVDYASRLVDDQEKLSARFGRLRDIIIEADYWRQHDSGPRLVTSEHVDRAIEQREYRLNLIEERLQEMIARGTLIIDKEGSVIGQVNGLSVLQLGDFRFGKPSRITARTFLGQRGVVSIDRESQLSGKIHDKGVLVLSGYLGSKYAHDKPLSLSASISFEQEYSPVDGDSASLAELCAILSSLAEVPIRQDLAMTGSVNQNGVVQPIGGLNQKIEGFHDVCRTAGFTGSQGVIMPALNKDNLMLRRDVVESVRNGQFHVYSVRTVEEAVELLTGVPAGERQEDGSYPEGTINHRVDARLREMGEMMRRFGRPQNQNQAKDGERKPEEPGPDQPPRDPTAPPPEEADEPPDDVPRD